MKTPPLHNRTGFTIIALLATLAWAWAACGDDDGAGTVQVEIWGEEYIEEGIPATAFEDGWAVHFDTFVISVGAITAAGEPIPGTYAYDLTVTGPLDVASAEAPAGDIAQVAYAIQPVTATTVNVNVDSTLLSDMQTAGYSVWVEGSATKDGSTVTYAWGFDVSVAYGDCHATGNVPDGGTGTSQLTIHGDHLFYESLVDAEGGLRFQVLADADADGNGDVTPAELAAFSGTAFGALDNYDVPAGSGIDNLWDYLSAQVATLGHIDGEGHCE